MENETKGLARRIHGELPIFSLPVGERHCLYVPGYIAVVSPEAAARMKKSWEEGITTDDAGLQKTADRLVQLARNSAEAWRSRTDTPFVPECLTIYLSNRCNCACTYCYAAVEGGQTATINRRHRSPVISREAVRSAAELVAHHCREKGQAFRVVFHGGGEPTLHWRLLQQLVSLTRQVASGNGIEWWGYIATNGVLPEERVSWLADHFNHIGISCDGPPDIQDQQRPRHGGFPSSPFIERTARVLRQKNASFAVRATITPETIGRQEEIVTYLAEVLGATEVRFEPVYRVKGAGEKGFPPDEASLFVTNFLAAEAKARELGCRLLYSGVRLDELHGTYCDVARDVLHIIPDNSATACFFDVGVRASPSYGTRIGYWDKAISTFVLDHGAIAAHRQKSLKIPERCRDCINIYHCARECPEFCEARAQPEAPLTRPGFRCKVARLLTERWILQLSEKLPVAGQTTLNQVGLNYQSDRERVRDTLAAVSSSVDSGEILKQWEAAKHLLRGRRRTLPAPVWAQRQFEQDGKEAWRLLRGIIEKGSRQAISVYLHIPFCDRRCAFCDCYSFPLRASQKGEARLFVQTLQDEINAWASLGGLADRKVTTVHFGGGTPSYLEPDTLLRLVRSLKSRFCISSETEWALESTSSMLTENRVSRLHEQGFTRLHVGVQTLESGIRQRIGRRETAGQVLSKLERLIKQGFVVSVDLIYGLPGQSVAGFVDTLEKLVTAGVQGFSLYQLQTGTRNRRFLEKEGVSDRDLLGDYLFLQIADSYLQTKGYRKNHFAHYAYPEDANLYYRHAVRGEDLLALGPTADGVFGTYHYRHGEYNDYLQGTNESRPGLEGGLVESETEQRIRQGVAHLMGGRIAKRSVAEMAMGALVDSWEDRRLVRRYGENGDYILTGNGTWFIADMLRELAANTTQP